MTIEKLVDRFLSWKLPKNFAPDAGISFKPSGDYESHWWPIGTNLLTAEQARQMLEYVLAGDAGPARSAEPQETPMTDAAAFSREFVAREIDRYDAKFVLADVARQLERELSQAREQIAISERSRIFICDALGIQDTETFADCLNSIDSLREQIAEWQEKYNRVNGAYKGAEQRRMSSEGQVQGIKDRAERAEQQLAEASRAAGIARDQQERAEQQLAEYRKLLDEAVSSVRCTQNPDDYPEDDWFKKAAALTASPKVTP